MKRKHPENLPEACSIVYELLPTLPVGLLGLSEGGHIQSVQRRHGLAYQIQGMVSGTQDKDCLLESETALEQTIRSKWSTWFESDDSLCFQQTDPARLSLQFTHPTCTILKSKSLTQILDFDLEHMQWETLQIQPQSIWVNRQKNLYGIRYTLKEMICSDIQ